MDKNELTNTKMYDFIQIGAITISAPSLVTNNG